LIDGRDRKSLASGGREHSQFYVPAEDVTDVEPEEQDLSEIVWLPTAVAGSITGIHVIIARPNHGEAELHGMVPFGAFTLVNGETVLLFSLTSPSRRRCRRMA
jgi:hypothetical protein